LTLLTPHSTEYIELGNHVRSYCGQNAAKYNAIASTAHDVSGIAACHGTVWGKLRPDQFEALAAFVDYVRAEESIPLARERIETDEQSDRAEFPLTVEALQE
jgi:hypothetical protein